MNYTNSAYANLTPEAAARKLTLAGYRQTSRGYGIVARVDLSDKELIEFAIIEDLVGIESLKDYYRRCHAEDKLESVPEEVMNLI